MTIRLRTAFFIIIGLLVLWFIYLERAILTPFILAAIFAYIFNPVVNFFSEKIKLPRVLSVIIIYIIILSVLVTGGLFVSKRFFDESSELRNFINTFFKTAREQIAFLPDWFSPTAKDALTSFQKSKIFQTQSLFTLFPEAISRIVSFFIFLFAGFFFLKEGRSIFDKFLNIIPNDYKVEVEILVRKINTVFGRYLRGQIFMVFLVALILYILLSVLGIKFALLLAVFSGFAEIVPIIGPIIAAIVSAFVVLTTGTVNFSLTPLEGAIAVGVIYFVTRHFQDYFIVPYVMGKITDLHPLMIFFAVLAGGHTFGILGFILAVPVAAIIKILLEFSLEKINKSSNSDTKDI